MSDEVEVVERPLGWLRVAAVAIVSAAGPVWMLCTAIVIQLSPELNGTQVVMEEGVPVVEPVRLSAWFFAGRVVAAWMVFALPFVLAAITLGRFAWEAARLRNEAERARYDALVADDAVIDDPDWNQPG